MNALKAIFSILFLMLCLMACKDEEAELARTRSAEKKSLTCEMERLKLKSDSLWDEVGMYLDKNLPTDMPLPERTNMVSIRSAHLIVLFKAFPNLDTAIQSKVNEAGKADKSIAGQMKAVMDKMHEAERGMNEALQKIETRSKQHYQTLKLELQALEKQPCQS
jgi:hypothetical protein